MRKAKPLLLFAALAAFGTLSLAGVAQAHSRPVRFDPAPGAVVEAAPPSVTGWFTSDIRRAEESFIQVLDHDGANVAAGDIQLSEDRRQMSVALRPGVAEGRYIVYWSTFDDADGEVFGGCYAFFVGQAAADDAVANGEALDAAADCPAAAEADHTDEPAVESNALVELSVSVSDRSADLTILPVNFTPREPDETSVDPNFGHYHIYLDAVPVAELSGAHEEGQATTGDEHGSPNVTPVIWAENSYRFTDLAPGVHTVSVVLIHDDHTPLQPPVVAWQSFTVGGASEDDSGSGVPAWTLALAIAGGLVVGGVGMKLVGGRA